MNGERRLQVGLMLAVGSAAGAAAYARVVDLATRHGVTGDVHGIPWRAHAVAVVIETMAVSTGLEIRRRRSAGEQAWLPTVALVAFVGVQVAAQLAEAERSAWGWTLAAVIPAGFLTLVKMAMVRPVTGQTAPMTDHEHVTADRMDEQPPPELPPGGRPPVGTPVEVPPEILDAVRAGQMTQKAAASAAGVGISTIVRRLREATS